jgi:hypothetical protein
MRPNKVMAIRENMELFQVLRRSPVNRQGGKTSEEN